MSSKEFVKEIYPSAICTFSFSKYNGGKRYSIIAGTDTIIRNCLSESSAWDSAKKITVKKTLKLSICE